MLHPPMFIANRILRYVSMGLYLCLTTSLSNLTMAWITKGRRRRHPAMQRPLDEFLPARFVDQLSTMDPFAPLLSVLVIHSQAFPDTPSHDARESKLQYSFVDGCRASFSSCRMYLTDISPTTRSVFYV